MWTVESQCGYVCVMIGNGLLLGWLTWRSYLASQANLLTCLVAYRIGGLKFGIGIGVGARARARLELEPEPEPEAELELELEVPL